MENLVPLGTGNSRLMKSNIPANTTLAQLIQMWNNGTFPYDIGPLNSAGISQQGTPLNKDTLLKDATAALFGLGTDAVPDDVLAKLVNAAFVENGGLTDVGGNSVGIQIATGSYVGTGKYGKSNPNTLTFDFEPKVWGVYSHVSHIDNNSYVTLYDKNIFPWGINTEEFEIATNTYWTISFDGNKANWYGTNATYQRNSSGIMYYYFALG